MHLSYIRTLILLVSFIDTVSYHIHANTNIISDNSMIDQYHNQLVPRHFPLRLDLPCAIPHRGRVLLYYVTPGGETVADAVHFEAGACLKHKVHNRQNRLILVSILQSP